MLVETFEVLEHETGEQAPEMEAEAIEIIETLGLTGQQGLLHEDDGGVVTRTPYRIMTAEEERIYGFLCPQQSVIEDYKSGPIPLRVLQVASHACTVYDKVEVWHSPSLLEKDPVLVGFDGTDYQAKKFLLARWGDELGSLEELRARCIERWLVKTTKAVETKMSDCKAFIASIEHKAEEHFDGAWVHVP